MVNFHVARVTEVDIDGVPQGKSKIITADMELTLPAEFYILEVWELPEQHQVPTSYHYAQTSNSPKVLERWRRMHAATFGLEPKDLIQETDI